MSRMAFLSYGQCHPLNVPKIVLDWRLHVCFACSFLNQNLGRHTITMGTMPLLMMNGYLGAPHNYSGRHFGTPTIPICVIYFALFNQFAKESSRGK